MHKLIETLLSDMKIPETIISSPNENFPLRETPYRCPSCRDGGFVRRDVDIYHENFGKPIRCPDCQMVQREIQERQLLALNTASIQSKRSALKTFQNFESRSGSKEAYQAAIKFAQNPSKWVYLWGKPGNGKSHLSAAVKNALTAAGQAVIMQTWPQLVEELRKSFKNDSHSRVFETIQTVEVLVLDDLLAERPTEYVLERLFLLIDYRYNNFLPTFITSNFAPDKISEFRVASRLRDIELVTVVHNAASDYRFLG